MKKSLIVASLLLVGSSALVAADMDNSWFVGGEFGAMNIKAKASASDGTTAVSATDTINATYEAIKIGKYFEYGRIYGAISRQNSKDDFSSNNFGIGYDYLFKNKSEFTPFLGANVMYTKGKTKDVPLTDAPTGLNYGVEAGILYAITKNTELELGARYLVSNVDDSISAGAAYAKIEGKNITQYYVGLNYKF